MVDQTQMNEGATLAGETATRAVARSTGEFLHDLVTLSELQLRLLVFDARQGLHDLLWPAAVLAAGIVIGCACLPVMLIALALALVETVLLSPAQAVGVTVLAGLIVTVLLIGGGLLWLRRRDGIFDRSRTEWRQNARWVKDAVQRLRE